MSVIPNDPMVSLKDYLQKAVGPNGPGLKVFKMSKDANIKSELRPVNGKQHTTVRVYPQSFLKSIDDFLTPYKA